MLPLLERKAAEVDDVYDEAAEQMALGLLVERRYRAMLRALHLIIGEAFGIIEDFRLDDEATGRILLAAAERVVMIDDVTRNAIREQLSLGQRLGLSTYEIANGRPDIGYHGIDGLYEQTWRGRAETIARTELQHAQALSAYDRYTASGLVDRVKIHDGDFDVACASRNGTVVPIAARPMPLHPNCRMAIEPVLREGVI